MYVSVRSREYCTCTPNNSIFQETFQVKYYTAQDNAKMNMKYVEFTTRCSTYDPVIEDISIASTNTLRAHVLITSINATGKREEPNKDRVNSEGCVHNLYWFLVWD